MENTNISANPLEQTTSSSNTTLQYLEGHIVKKHFGGYLGELLTAGQFSTIDDNAQYTSISHVLRTLINGTVFDNILKHYINLSEHNIHQFVLNNIFDALYYSSELLFKCLLHAQKDGKPLPNEELINMEFVETVRLNSDRHTIADLLNATSHSLAMANRYFDYDTCASVSRGIDIELTIVPTKDGKNFNLPFEFKKLFDFTLSSSEIVTGNAVISNQLATEGYPIRPNTNLNLKFNSLTETFLHVYNLLGEHPQFTGDVKALKNHSRGLADLKIESYNCTLFSFPVAMFTLRKLGFEGQLGNDIMKDIILESKHKFDADKTGAYSVTGAIIKAMQDILRINDSDEARAYMKLLHVINMQYGLALYQIKFN